MATHKSLKVTFWTRTVDLIKGMLLYGTVNWRRASDGLKPPKLSPVERRHAMPAKNLEVIKPRYNPQAALIKTLPKKPVAPKAHDVTAGAIVSDPYLGSDGMPTLPGHRSTPSSSEFVRSEQASEESLSTGEETVVMRRRRRHHRHGLLAKRAPRSAFVFSDSGRPGLLARLFGAK